jgi:hypothetical protein
MKLTGLDVKNIRSSDCWIDTMEKRKPRKRGYAVCIRNTGYAASLEPRKLYEIVPPEPHDPPDMMRMIDESGEDYLYPADLFLAVPLPAETAKALSHQISATDSFRQRATR